jgi:hypothetical protein
MFGCSSKPDEATQMVIHNISELEQKKPIKLADIARVKERYNSLTDKQKEMVSNYAELLSMEDNYAELGKVELTLHNYKKYLDVNCEWSFCGASTEWRGEGGADIYNNITTLVQSSGLDKYQYNDVKIKVRFNLDYYPYTKTSISGRNYGLRAGTLDEVETTDNTIKCDENGVGRNIDFIDCRNGLFGERGISTADFTVIEISGTVLPLE